jgi:polysaccharide deacetylase family protein (PEP-CTERM system associated)
MTTLDVLPAKPPERALSVPNWRECCVPDLLVAPLPRGGHATACAHVFSVDVEDWQQSVFDGSLPVSERFVAGTMRVAELLAKHRARATFFVLGNAAEVAPDLIRDLARAGHEIQTHGYNHRPIHALTPDGFREDLLRAKGVLEDLLGRPVVGYRAPRFSIDRRTVWALDVLAECGFEYDSSIFPLRIRGYGISGWPRTPHRVKTAAGNEIIEVPVSVGSLLGMSVPMAGGGYVRALPVWMIRAQIQCLEAAGQSAVLYCHPYEFDFNAFAELPFHVPLKQRLHQGLGRRNFSPKIEHILSRFEFTSNEQMLETLTTGRFVPRESPAGEPVEIHGGL